MTNYLAPKTFRTQDGPQISLCIEVNGGSFCITQGKRNVLMLNKFTNVTMETIYIN